MVEIIVILVVLAILAAILIPSFAKWIDKAKEKSAIVEARTCLLAMQTIAVERFARAQTYNLASDKAETLLLAESPTTADITDAAVDASATVTRMVYLASNGYVVTYSNGVFTASTSSYSFGTRSDVDALISAMENAGASVLDSNAAAFSGTAAKDLIAALTAQGVNLNAMGAATWHYDCGNNMLYWTNESISTKTSGEKVYVMKFNSNSGNYTVWQMTVATRTAPSGDTYMVLDQEVRGSMKGPVEGQQSYQNALDIFNGLS